jgi:hypothetical protein
MVSKSLYSFVESSVSGGRGVSHTSQKIARQPPRALFAQNNYNVARTIIRGI